MAITYTKLGGFGRRDRAGTTAGPAWFSRQCISPRNRETSRLIRRGRWGLALVRPGSRRHGTGHEPGRRGCNGMNTKPTQDGTVQKPLDEDVPDDPPHDSKAFAARHERVHHGLGFAFERKHLCGAGQPGTESGQSRGMAK